MWMTKLNADLYGFTLFSFCPLYFFVLSLQYNMPEKKVKHEVTLNVIRYKRLEKLMQTSRADFTITFRQLSNLPEEMKNGEKSKDLFESFLLKHAFYDKDLSSKIQDDFVQWIEDWRSQLESENLDLSEVSKRMKQLNPKYVPREWMLVRAYTAAQQGDYSNIRELYELSKIPTMRVSVQLRLFPMKMVKHKQSNKTHRYKRDELEGHRRAPSGSFLKVAQVS